MKSAVLTCGVLGWCSSRRDDGRDMLNKHAYDQKRHGEGCDHRVRMSMASWLEVQDRVRSDSMRNHHGHRLRVRQGLGALSELCMRTVLERLL